MIEKNIIANIPIDQAWTLWSTSDGLKTFFGQDNNFELSKGGPFEIYFDMSQPPGLRGSEDCKVIDFIPQKMLSFTWNAPLSILEIRNSGYKTTVAVFFKSIDDGKTEIKLIHHGFMEGEKWIEYKKYFENAWDIVLQWFNPNNSPL
ncbi:MAG TPA: SRPBCC domain-containing protein [Bacteroidetes bacterium]|nr:SRPBCC domain-containing protein [Bacteroidota bacterium]